MNGILVEALVEGLQARLPFSPDDRKELDYQLRVGQFAGFINGLSLFYCSNKLVTGAGDRVRVYPGIYEVYVRRANEDPTEPVTVVNCSRQNQREASFRVVQPRVTQGVIDWDVVEERSATSDDLDNLGGVLNEVSGPETISTRRNRAQEADILDMVYKGLRGRSPQDIPGFRVLSVDTDRLRTLAERQSAERKITSEAYFRILGLLPFYSNPGENEITQARSLLVKPQWVPLT